MPLIVYILDRPDFVGHDIRQVLRIRTWECQTILFQRLLKYGVGDFKTLQRQNGKSWPTKKLPQKGHTVRPFAIRWNAYVKPKIHAATCSSVIEERS